MSQVLIKEYNLSDRDLNTEQGACYKVCREVYPEHPERLFGFFQKLTEKVSFGIGTCTDGQFTIGQRPTPVVKRQEWIITAILGVETSRCRFTGLPILVKKKFVIDIRSLQ